MSMMLAICDQNRRVTEISCIESCMCGARRSSVVVMDLGEHNSKHCTCWLWCVIRWVSI